MVGLSVGVSVGLFVGLSVGRFDVDDDDGVVGIVPAVNISVGPNWLLEQGQVERIHITMARMTTVKGAKDDGFLLDRNDCVLVFSSRYALGNGVNRD